MASSALELKQKVQGDLMAGKSEDDIRKDMAGRKKRIKTEQARVKELQAELDKRAATKAKPKPKPKPKPKAKAKATKK